METNRNLSLLGRVEIGKAVNRLCHDYILDRFWNLPHKDGCYPSAIVLAQKTKDRSYSTWLAFRNGYGHDDLVIFESGHYDIMSERSAMEDARCRVEMYGGRFSRMEMVSY